MLVILVVTCEGYCTNLILHIAGASDYKLEFSLYKNPGVALGPPVANTVLHKRDLMSGLLPFTTSISIF